MKTHHIALALLFLSVVLLPQNTNRADDSYPSYGLDQEDCNKLIVLRDKQDIPGMIDFCASFQDQWERRCATKFLRDRLRELPKEKVVPHLKKSLNHKISEIREACWDLLVLARDPIALTYIVDRISPPSLSPEQKAKAEKLIMVLGGTNDTERESCRKQLIEMGPSVAEILMLHYKNDNEIIAKAAREIAGIVHPPFDEWELYAIYSFSDNRTMIEAHKTIIANEFNPPETIKTAIYTLGFRGEPRDTDVIRPYLKKDSPYLKEAIDAVGHLKDMESVPVLIALLDSGLHNEHIVRALGNIGDKRAIEPLEKNLIRHDHIREKFQHAYALDNCGKSEYLIKLIANTPEPIRPSVYPSYRSESLKPVLLEYIKTTKNQAFAMKTITYFRNFFWDGKTFPALIEAIRAKRKEMRIKPFSSDDIEISKTLLCLGDAEEEKAVLAMAKGPAPEKRYHALSILSGIRTQKYIPVFITYCYDSSYFKNPEYDYKYMVRQAARRGLLSVPEIRKYYDPWYIDMEKNIKEIIANWKKEHEKE